MEERYRTPNGNILTRNELISQYGESKFQGFLEKGKITLVEDDQNSDSEVEFEDNGEVFITPNGNELTSTELVSQYGAEKFKSFLSDGKIKKKDKANLVLNQIFPLENRNRLSRIISQVRLVMH
jgi:hypothetical protein